jgi:hypothetical protein
MTVNAFHPEYMKTHEPHFMKDFRTHEANRQAAAAVSSYVTKQRKVKPSHGTVFGISEKVKAVTAPAHMHRRKSPINTKAEQKKTMNEVRNELIDKLKQTPYRTYSRAGAK